MTESIFLLLATGLILVALVILTVGLHLIGKARQMVLQFGPRITVRMQDRDYDLLLERFALTVANSDEAATLCVVMAKAAEDANLLKSKTAADTFKRIMGHQEWKLVYELDDAKRLTAELLKATQMDRKVMK